MRTRSAVLHLANKLDPVREVPEEKCDTKGANITITFIATT